MGWIATPQLVAASSNAGAFGFLAGAVMKPVELGEAIARLKKALGSAPDEAARTNAQNLITSLEAGKAID